MAVALSSRDRATRLGQPARPAWRARLRDGGDLALAAVALVSALTLLVSVSAGF
jgi:hypothetical protein